MFVFIYHGQTKAVASQGYRLIFQKSCNFDVEQKLKTRSLNEIWVIF